MELGLEGKVALVTGAAHGIGAEIVRALAGEGLLVAINYNSSAEKANQLADAVAASGGKAVPFHADVSDHGKVVDMVAQITDNLGSVDILVNNAGYVKSGRFVDSVSQDWKRQIESSLLGAIHCCHGVAPQMIDRGFGRIINIVGDSSRVGQANLAVAAAARGGTISLGKSLALEMGRYGICVNTLSLGLIETERSDQGFLEANLDRILKAYPMRRIGIPQDVAPMVALLASEAGSWITGQTISVNGGYAMP